MTRVLGEIMIKYPIGTCLKLVDDDPDVFHKVVGYEIYSRDAFILFHDTTKLHVVRLDLIKEVMPDGDVA